ncbi:MAG: squalene/phytoene synthase family protein [Planctomycetaceae bacterium]|jgi:phytoene/squalene synthetase|nr:squalene/phytoene synthase family protein [Planctomycetaceae bacterium]
MNISKFDDRVMKIDDVSDVYLLSEAADYCRRKAREHYENFSVASFLLPCELRLPMEIIYAYCRYSDDLGDDNDGSEIARKIAVEKLNQWEIELNKCFNFALNSENLTTQLTPDNLPVTHPIFVALINVVRRFRLSKEPFANLLTAFRQDQIKQQYETMDELLGYCRNSADPVGRIVLHLAFAADRQRKIKNIAKSKFNPKSPQENTTTINTNNEIKIDQKLLNWSDSICTGLQLANFWQDISRDLLLGRCYIPREIALRYGVDLGRLSWGEEFRLMMIELVADARKRILDGVPLLDELPDLIKFDIAIIIRGGLAILDAIKNINYNVLKQRPIVSRLKKFNIIIATLIRKKITSSQ